jgi:hypothetical protein
MKRYPLFCFHVVLTCLLFPATSADLLAQAKPADQAEPPSKETVTAMQQENVLLPHPLGCQARISISRRAPQRKGGNGLAAVHPQ